MRYAPIDLTCYVYPGWRPRIRSALARRPWMDETPEGFAYRCLPMNIANAHGWELLSPCNFEAEWSGGPGVGDVSVRRRSEDGGGCGPVSLFGQGVLTFHVEGIFKTPPGFNLWVGPSPNSAKDGISALAGLIETDWSPYTFTMNWRFTRPGVVRFSENEPFCFLFPVERGLIERVRPRLSPIASAPDDLKARCEAWSASRDHFNANVRDNPPQAPADKWQKFYYRGTDADGRHGAGDHQTKIRLPEFEGAETFTAACPYATGSDKSGWLQASLERLRGLASNETIPRRPDLQASEFRDFHYAVNRPVIIPAAIRDWPAVSIWTPEYLKAAVGDRVVQVQANRNSSPRFERDKDAHTTTMAFRDFVDRISIEAGNDLYLTAYNSAANVESMATLERDLGTLDELLAPGRGMIWMGPHGTFTPLHHDLTNNLLLQIVGRKSIILAAPSETPNLYNDQHVFSRVIDLDAPDALERFKLLENVKIHRVELHPGDALFIPLGWWHQVRALDFSVTITHTNFHLPNDFHMGYPE